MCLHSEMNPICDKDSKVPTESKGANSSLDKASSSRHAQMSSHRLSRKKRKPKRVLYPAQVRKYLPRQEQDKAKKWLLILGVIVFFQIFLEDGDQCDHEVHKTLVAHDSKTIKFVGHANSTMDSGLLLAEGFTVHGPQYVTLGNYTILYFSRTKYYDLRNDSARKPIEH